MNHSGNAPDKMRETPVNDFNKTTLQSAVEQNLITIPETTEAVRDRTPSTETTPRIEKKGFTKKQKLIAGISGAFLTLGLGAGLKSMSDNQQIAPTGPVATAKATPTTAPTPEASATSTETATQTTSPEGSALVAAYESLPIGQFNELPRDQRLKVVYDTYSVLGQGYLTGYMSDTLSDGKAIGDHNPAVNQAYPTDNGQVIIDQYVFANAAAAALKINYTAEGDGPLNLDGAQQLLSGVTYEVGSKDKSNEYNGMVGILKQNVNAQKLTGFGSFMALDTSPMGKGVDAEGQPIEYKDVLLNPGTGHTSKLRFVFTTFADKDGQSRSLWLVMSDQPATTL